MTSLSGLLMMVPSAVTDVVGILVLAAAFGWQYTVAKTKQKKVRLPFDVRKKVTERRNGE